MMKDKYIDEKFKRWMKWGGWINPGDNGDVNDGYGDIATNLPPEVANKLVAAREKFCDEITAIFQEHSEYFHNLTDYAQ